MTSDVVHGSSFGGSLRAGTSARALMVLLLLATTAQFLHAQTFTVLHTFEGPDGDSPRSELTLDEAGNLYGTTLRGGDLISTWCEPIAGCGVVFKLDPSGNLTVLHTFENVDGAGPSSGLLRDKAGNLYGEVSGYGPKGNGEVFVIDTAGTMRILHGFYTGKGDGGGPMGGLVGDQAANVYGVTDTGGNGRGTVFKLNTKSGREQTLYALPWLGGEPQAGLVRDAAGNLYGATVASNPDILFKIDSSGNYTTLANAPGPVYSAMVLDSAGTLYGATGGGGLYGEGVLFKFDTAGNLTTLYTFNATNGHGVSPYGRLTHDAEGNLYGTTSYHPSTVFKLDPLGNLTTLYTFTGGADGASAWSGVVRDAAGNLYGTTFAGGDLSCDPPNGCGVIFKISF